MSTVLDTSTAAAVGRPGAFGNATHLSCRSCGTSSDLGPF
jgi:threonine synthase